MYFQATKLESPVHSGVDFLPIACTIAPGAVGRPPPTASLFRKLTRPAAAGVTITIFKQYRPQNYVGWLLCCLGTGLLHLLNTNASEARYISVQIPMGLGLGMLFSGTTFPILASLPLSETAHALAQLTFLRNFALVGPGFYSGPHARF